jgi:hypothetical protein
MADNFLMLYFIEIHLKKPIGGIKYRKSTIRNQSLFQKLFFLSQWAPKGVKWITNMFKKGWIFSNQSIKQWWIWLNLITPIEKDKLIYLGNFENPNQEINGILDDINSFEGFCTKLVIQIIGSY